MNVSPVTIRLADAATCDLKALATIQRKCNMQMKFNGFFAAISDVSKETIEIDVDLSEFDACNMDDRATHPDLNEPMLCGRDTIPEIDRETLEIMLQPALAVVMLAA
jgi:hypothetical protein